MANVLDTGDCTWTVEDPSVRIMATCHIAVPDLTFTFTLPARLTLVAYTQTISKYAALKRAFNTMEFPKKE
jgi:hypothetical protein